MKKDDQSAPNDMKMPADEFDRLMRKALGAPIPRDSTPTQPSPNRGTPHKRRKPRRPAK